MTHASIATPTSGSRLAAAPPGRAVPAAASAGAVRGSGWLAFWTCRPARPNESVSTLNPLMILRPLSASTREVHVYPA
ncbi:MAG: hypothetical protein IPN45_11765 [Actinomycetales bacterium]|nr:hypothetical protein [Actinomycetales bacterium]